MFKLFAVLSVLAFVADVKSQQPIKMPPVLKITFTGNHPYAGTTCTVIQAPAPLDCYWFGTTTTASGIKVQVNITRWAEVRYGLIATIPPRGFVPWAPAPLIAGGQCYGGGRLVIVDSVSPFVAHSDPAADGVGGFGIVTDGNQANLKILSPLLGVQITE